MPANSGQGMMLAVSCYIYCVDNIADRCVTVQLDFQSTLLLLLDKAEYIHWKEFSLCS
jgi:hypothetical protein